MEEAPPSIPTALSQLELPWLQEMRVSPVPTPEEPEAEVFPDPPSLPQTPVAITNPHKLSNLDGHSAEPNWPQRVLHLEQALDQCQVYIEELKQQLVEQQFLEDILARTEETAQIQQQAILSLKQQLADYYHTQGQLNQLQASHTALQDQLQHLQQAYDHQADLFKESQALTQQRQAEINQLQHQLRPHQEQIQLLQYRIGQLESQVQDRQQRITDLESRLQRSAQIVATQQEIITALQKAQGPESSKNQVIQGLSQNLLTAQTKIYTLETEYSSQRLHQAQLQHHAQEVEEHAIQQQVRINKLEQQVAEMQEQILHQAQQEREQETAIQHWKDRHHQADATICQLKAVLTNILTDRKLLELIHLDADSIRISWGTGEEVSNLLHFLEMNDPAPLSKPAKYLSAADTTANSEDDRELNPLPTRIRGH
ncbi:hypothetical protein [Synechococcus sp. PCC 6312]|uniref:hypothetical protein n=1 Tax=Synechococcus sp. (strain ATCC 27167 / PCC 6312) TaxID=195253 RepID=UPI00029ED764|nr:hypothetical protein [Synechococcus sp. PCC 6312]AFY62598.1 hypothetical protein Syn6312_3579 [Synechococcus sp. PCC 6312]